MNKIIRISAPFIFAFLFISILMWLAGASSRVTAAPSLSTLEGTILVTSLEDELKNDGDCSLREAIQAANTNTAVDACGTGEVLTDTITFDVAGIITVTSQLSVTAGGPLVIDGGDVTTTSGDGTTRVWWVETGSDLTLRRIVVMNGYAYGNGAGLNNEGALMIINSTLSGNEAEEFGGAIANAGTLAVHDSVLSGNSAFYGGAITNGGTLKVTNSTFSGNSALYGGGVGNSGTMTITNSTFSGNSAIIIGGGIINIGITTIANSTFSGNIASGHDWTLGGGIDNGGELTIHNSTFSGNTASSQGDSSGGGINNEGDLTIHNSTFSGNSADYGGGINEYEEGNATLNNTIIAYSPSGGDCAGTIADGGHNLDLDGTCGLDPANGSLPDTDPLLGPLQDNGGPTLTHALLEGSPAIDAGDDVQCPLTDQRGVYRPLDGDEDGVAVCDIGSYEFGTGHLLVNTLEDELNNDGVCSLREAVKAANTNTVVDMCADGGVLTDTITFDVMGTITVSSQLEVTAGGPLMIDGGDVITTSGGGTTRVWWVETDSELSLNHLAVINGYIFGDNGAGLYNNSGNVTIVNCSLAGNIASGFEIGGAGGAVYNAGSITIYNSNFSGNDASSGAGIHNTGSLTITSSTLFGNDGYVGGAISNDGLMVVSNSTLSDNNGSGIYNYYGFLTLINSILSGNSAVTAGGAIYNTGTLTVTNSTISGNAAKFRGGGIFNFGSLMITNSPIIDNIVGGPGGRIGGQGGGIENVGTLVISNSTISSNTAYSGVSDPSDGGGIYNDGTLTITSSTIHDNSSDRGGGVLNGGVDNGVCYSSGGMVVENSTFTDNTAVTAGGGTANFCDSTTMMINSTISGNESASGGGIYQDTGDVEAINTIVTNNPSGGDCMGMITDGGHNISSDDTCSFDSANGSMPNTDPLLGSLQDNGGPTWTHALLPSSPAIDAGDDVQCPPADQRGVPRPQDGDRDGWAICDIGSYELEGPPVSPTLVTISGASEGLLGQVTYFTATVEPISTTLPLTYVWQASGHPPITETRGLTDTVGWVWEMPGMQIITVTASNSAGSVTDTHIITITSSLYELYLPLIITAIEAPLAPTPASSLSGSVVLLGLVVCGATIRWKWRS